jgi:hypothetical protein
LARLVVLRPGNVLMVKSMMEQIIEMKKAE